MSAVESDSSLPAHEATWEIDRGTDPILDTMNITASLRASGEKKSFLADGRFLVLRCRESELALYVVRGRFGALGLSMFDDGGHPVTRWFDREEPRTEPWGRSTRPSATFAPRPAECIARIAQDRRLAVRPQTKDGGSLTGVFALSRAGPVVEEVLGACGPAFAREARPPPDVSSGAQADRRGPEEERSRRERMVRGQQRLEHKRKAIFAKALSVPVGRTPEGAVVRRRVAVDLEPSGRLSDAGPDWTRTLASGSMLGIGARLIREPGPVAGGNPETVVFAGLRIARQGPRRPGPSGRTPPACPAVATSREGVEFPRGCDAHGAVTGIRARSSCASLRP